MAPVQQAKTFWKTVRSVSVAAIAHEADKPFSFAVVGDPANRAELLAHLFPRAESGPVVPERSLVQAYDSTTADAGFPTGPGSVDLVVDAGGGRGELPSGAVLYSVEELGGWERTAQRMLEDRPDLALALARRFPGLRPQVAEQIVRDTAMANAEFAMLNALPGVIPVLEILLPVGAIGDIYMLTKNQAMMLFRLAAAYGLPLDVRARSRDLVPLLGNALGWRAIAREVVGVVPGGIGLVARGAIAYAGTAALGRALARYYETGEPPTRAQIARFYREAYGRAKQVVRERLARLRGRVPADTRALPAGPDETEGGNERESEKTEA